MVAEEAKVTSNHKAAAQYGIAERNVRDWRKNEEKIRQALAQGGKGYRLKGQSYNLENEYDALTK